MSGHQSRGTLELCTTWSRTRVGELQVCAGSYFFLTMYSVRSERERERERAGEGDCRMKFHRTFSKYVREAITCGFECLE